MGILLNCSKADLSSKPLWKNVDPGLSFVYDSTVSDEFNIATIDTSKWSENGLENGNAGCPKWNGPVDWDNPNYSTYFKTKKRRRPENMESKKRKALDENRKAA